jgi:hypothetical protein
MHLKATWRNGGWGLRLCAAVIAGLPMALCAQTPPAPTPPISRASWATRPQAQPAAKPSAAVPASQLPPMPVTQPATAPTFTMPTPTPPPVPATPGERLAHRATVQYANGLVTVTAHNSSLNQILRAIMRQTGLQISGGVTEERVYGVYGPARLSTVLGNLLDGTGSNILFVPATPDQPAQLSLTPREGGAMPPPPSASAADDQLPDGSAEDSAPTHGPQVAAAQPDSKPDAATEAAFPSIDYSPGSGNYPEPPFVLRKHVTMVPPRSTDEIYQQLLQVYAAEQKLGQQKNTQATSQPQVPIGPATGGVAPSAVAPVVPAQPTTHAPAALE